jgi:hypothetical protein
MAPQDMGSEIKMNHYILCRHKCSTIPKISYLGIVAGQRKRFRCFARAADCIQLYMYTSIPRRLYTILYLQKYLQSLKISV